MKLRTGILRIVPLLTGMLMLLASAPGQAQTLSSLFDRARSDEPGYLAMVSAREAAQARTRQAFGALLPQVSLTANTNINDRDYATRNSQSPSMQDRYNSNSGQLNITQPIWRYANIAGLDQAEAAAQQAEHQLAGAEQDLLAKLVAAWFDVLAARDSVVYSAQQVAATRRQWEVMQRGTEHGTASVPQAEEAKAKYDQAQAESVAAETDSRIKKAALEQLVGTLDELVPPVLHDNVMPAKFIESMREAKAVVAVSSDELQQIISDVLSTNAKAVADYKAGKQQSAMFLMGLIRRQLPKGDTQLILEQLKKALDNG